MSEGLPSYRLGFRAKVLLPTCAILAALATFLVWLVNQHFQTRLEEEAVQSVRTANAAFDFFQEVRTEDLRNTYRSLPTADRVRKVLSADDPKTLEFLLKELLPETGADGAFFTGGPAGAPEQKGGGGSPRVVGVSGAADIDWRLIQAACAPAVRRALDGEFNIVIVAAAGRLWEAVSVPLSTGAFTFAHEMGTVLAGKMRKLTMSEIVFVANGRIVASTVADWERMPELGSAVEEVSGGAEGHPRQIRLGARRYLGLSGSLPSLSRDQRLGYVLLQSTDAAWVELRRTQRDVVAAALVGILLGSLVVWLVLRHVFGPLLQLRAGAEAVGKGDFGHRVQVSSKDEIGELAVAFNRMTESLRTSREELEQTVERLRTTQAQLVQTEKLAAVGEFVAGVTHELNNPLTAVIGFAELLQGADLDPRCREDVNQIVNGAQRCRRIVRSLLSFARRYQPERKLSDLNELVENTLSFVQYEFHTSNIKIVRNLEPRLPKLMVDPHQLQQVFLNIVSNARQAIEGYRHDGELTVRTELASDRVRVSFADNGPGIAKEHIARLFDPFFTTKEVGKGTGLGLSLSYGIVKEHGGVIVATSQQGRGAVFTIELPMAMAQGVAQPSEAPGSHAVGDTREPPVGGGSAPETPKPAGPKRRVLAIDDEAPILRLVRAALQRHGYVVDVAQDGEEGLRRALAQPYDLVLCDWKMPGLNGLQVYERMVAADPKIASRVIFMTGDVVNERTQQFLEKHGRPCLSKPFSPAEFTAAVGRIIGGEA